MTNRSKNIGTDAERAVARYLATAGFPHAERRALNGSADRGDITGTPGIVWEIKGGDAARNASDGLIATWLEETERERIKDLANYGVLVVQRAGIGPANAGRWWAILQLDDVMRLVGNSLFLSRPTMLSAPTRLHLATVVYLLRLFGYGEPIGEDAS